MPDKSSPAEYLAALCHMRNGALEPLPLIMPKQYKSHSVEGHRARLTNRLVTGDVERVRDLFRRLGRILVNRPNTREFGRAVRAYDCQSATKKAANRGDLGRLPQLTANFLLMRLTAFPT